MNIGDRVRIKSGEFHNNKNESENLGRIESVEIGFCFVDMDLYDDLDDGNVLPVKLEDLEYSTEKARNF